MKVLPLVLALGGLAWAGDHWPQWRGPSLNGTSDSTNLPLSWSETENVKWKVPLPSWSGSTPAIWGDRIFVTSEKARTTVLAPGPEFKVLAENQLDDDWTLSSIAVAGSDLFIRTSSHLYCIGKK